jgi:CDP-4-dehydro-6-deoxyglucose reductase, E1
MPKFYHPLMHNNFTRSDFDSVRKFLKKDNILTQSKKVREFEEKWSKWLGIKYSIFVNSGSSANFLTFAAINIIFGSGHKVLVPTLTWVSDIVSVLKNNQKPVFLDINLKNLSILDENIEKKIDRKVKFIFLTHAQGFNGLSEKILQLCKKRNIYLIEDVCESHGAKFKNKKLGTFGLISNFSFYYAHHMSTIEGGMICTNNKKIYQLIRMLRSHGMLRESDDIKFKNKNKKKYKFLSPDFIFMHQGFNFRNNEISAVIGINQLKQLDKNNKVRVENLNIFLRNLDKNKFFTNFDLKGNSNYAFPLILKTKSIQNRNKLELTMKRNKIEFRRGNVGGGNQLRQPYLKNYVKNLKLKNFPNVEHVHFFGYYIGNFPSLKKNKILKITKILNSSF